MSSKVPASLCRVASGSLLDLLGTELPWEENIRKLSLHGLKPEQRFQLDSQIEFQDLLRLCSPAGLDTVLHSASVRLAGDWKDLEFLGPRAGSDLLEPGVRLL